MKTFTRISKKHGAMQINLSNWTFWFNQNKGESNGAYYPINAKTIEYWTGSKSPLTPADKQWFNESI
jgi:hypothetical protein